MATNHDSGDLAIEADLSEELHNLHFTVAPEALCRLGRLIAAEDPDKGASFFQQSLDGADSELAALLASGLVELGQDWTLKLATATERPLPRWFWLKTARPNSNQFQIKGLDGGAITVSHSASGVSCLLQQANGDIARFTRPLEFSQVGLGNWRGNLASVGIYLLDREGALQIGKTSFVSYLERDQLDYSYESLYIEWSDNAPASVSIINDHLIQASVQMSVEAVCRLYAALGGPIVEVMDYLSGMDPERLTTNQLRAIAFYHGLSCDMPRDALMAGQKRRHEKTAPAKHSAAHMLLHVLASERVLS